MSDTITRVKDAATLAKAIERKAATIEIALFLGGPFYCVARSEAGGEKLQTLDRGHNVCTSAWAE
jgi:hypothetical protein